MSDAAKNFDFVASALDIKSTLKWYTDYDPKYPYITGSLAAFTDETKNPTEKVCRYCKSGAACNTPADGTKLPATTEWIACDGANNTPAAAATKYYPKELAVPADSASCVDWQRILDGKIDLSIVELVRSGTPYYVC